MLTWLAITPTFTNNQTKTQHSLVHHNYQWNNFYHHIFSTRHETKTCNDFLLYNTISTIPHEILPIIRTYLYNISPTPAHSRVTIVEIKPPKCCEINNKTRHTPHTPRQHLHPQHYHTPTTMHPSPQIRGANAGANFTSDSPQHTQTQQKLAHHQLQQFTPCGGVIFPIRARHPTRWLFACVATSPGWVLNCITPGRRSHIHGHAINNNNPKHTTSRTQIAPHPPWEGHDETTPQLTTWQCGELPPNHRPPPPKRAMFAIFRENRRILPPHNTKIRPLPQTRILNYDYTNTEDKHTPFAMEYPLMCAEWECCPILLHFMQQITIILHISRQLSLSSYDHTLNNYNKHVWHGVRWGILHFATKCGHFCGWNGIKITKRSKHPQQPMSNGLFLRYFWFIYKWQCVYVPHSAW